MFGSDGRLCWLLAALWLVSACASAPRSAPPVSTPSPSRQSLSGYSLFLTLRAATEWRFEPLVVDLDGDGHLDLVVTARLDKPSLHIWRGDGRGGFSPVEPTWTDIGYGALATGDINGDGSPDIVAASHFGGVQTLLSDGRGGFTEKIVRHEDGHTGAQLADLNGDGHLDLILLGYRNAGIEVFFGDGTGNWTLHSSLPETRPGRTMPGRALVLGDLNLDGHVDLVAAFQRWGIYVYYGDGRGGFTGGPVEFPSAGGEYQSLSLGDVNGDGNPDIVINGTLSGPDQPNGPDVYLGDGRGGWKASSAGLKVMKVASAGIALGDLDHDGGLDIVAAGSATGDPRSPHSLFTFRGDGRGSWSLAQECRLPTPGSVPHGISVADLDHDGVPEIVVVSGGTNGSITVWKRE
jgi:hypothetical protein